MRFNILPVIRVFRYRYVRAGRGWAGAVPNFEEVLDISFPPGSASSAEKAEADLPESGVTSSAETRSDL
jgi:hypothetical protein